MIWMKQRKKKWASMVRLMACMYSDLKKVVGDIMKFGAVQRGYLGISMVPDDMDEAKKKEMGINGTVDGVYVMRSEKSGGRYYEIRCCAERIFRYQYGAR